MKHNKTNILIMLIILMVLCTTSTEAKWWIFGQSDDEVNINYLFLNKSSFDETGSKITVYKAMLPDGKITITGKATAGKGKIGSARISLDGRDNWNDANLSESGVFEYSFRPELGKTYAIYIEVSDTAGKTNDVKATYREVTVSDRDVTSVIKEALDKMIDAYKNHDSRNFMSLVSEDFAGDVANLDRAIRKDFSSFDNINLRYTLNNITSDAKGVSVSLSYSRMLTSTKSGTTFTDKGVTEFTFKLGDKGPKVFSMKNPLIFGITDTANVATGTIKPFTNDPVIIVDSRGNAAKVLPQLFAYLVTDDSLRITNNSDGTSTISSASTTATVDRNGNQTGGAGATDQTAGEDANASATVDMGNRILVSSGQPPVGFTFVDGEVVVAAGDFVITGGGPGYAYGSPSNGATLVDLGIVSIGTVNEAPASGYSSPAGLNFTEGHTYAFQLATGKYGLIEVKSVTEEWPGGVMTITMRFDYKYQTNGTRQFLP